MRKLLPARTPLVIALAACALALSVEGAGRADVVVETSPAVHTELILYEQHSYGALRFSALVKDRDGVWSSACDHTSGIEGPAHGDWIAARLTIHHERHRDFEITSCEVDVQKRRPLSEHQHVLFAPAALGPFAAGMPVERIARILGKSDVPHETTVGSHIQHGPFELQMRRGALLFVSARLSALAAPLIAAGSPTFAVATQFAPTGRSKEVGRAEVFRPSLSRPASLAFAKLRYTRELLGGAADLRPLAPDLLLFANRAVREPDQCAHLRSALIGLYRTGLGAEPPPTPR